MERELKKNTLGTTGLHVSEFCLGVLPMGPLQANLPAPECIKIIRRAQEEGVNFFDTAEFYRTQPYLGQALRGKRKDAVIATKSLARSYDDMARSVERSLEELQTDYIDIYHLHASRLSPDVFTTHSGALKCLVERKLANVIGNVGISTHNCKTVEKAAERDDIDIIFPILNSRGLGLIDGSVEDMVAAVAKASARGKGLYAMKALGGGNLLSDFYQALSWVRAVQGISSVAIGVVSEDELVMDLDVFRGKQINDGPLPAPKRLFIFTDLCKGCGTCIEICPNQALSFFEEKPGVDHSKCLLCGYCSGKCPQFAIRVV